jgi:Fe-S cluster biogenesis protein NfuA/nitrite reductase/ring-hydroxylating ferredoxin subunit
MAAAPLPESPLSGSESEPEPAGAALARLAGQIARLEQIASGWEQPHAGTLSAIKSAIEELNREAFRRLIRHLREDPACAARLRSAVRDPFLFGVLRFHGLVKDPLELRIEQALEEVRPSLRGHGGDVELVALKMPDTVEVRLVGSCHGCPSSSQTLTEGVERAIRQHCPEIQHIRQVSQPPPQRTQPGEPQVVHFTSPFARAGEPAGLAATVGPGWEEVCALDEIPDGGILTRTLSGREVLLYRRAHTVSCFDNACAHMGMPLDGGELREGTLQCPHHGFTYMLDTGECLTVPEVQLRVHAVKVTDALVRVRLAK